ncbi:hypothetical protein FOS14_21785 [Skermania sp. ID1734]|uniref:hypothetical protein n=1 Tax=Skermania sp. ID1734 TaxID=2597516 RepID=UPI00118071C3|nr:hypothetical protein [Skermania sp. ID1734]TSD93914.1 hypothetical protein FOS14_21785 [Skermania sp. ID1734]
MDTRTEVTDSLQSAIAEAERLIAAAPHVRTAQDLAEGYRYLAGGIMATVHAAWAGERDHPTFIQGTGPYMKMGLDNPDTLYFGTRIDDKHEYVVYGKRGGTIDLSFQVLSGNYTDTGVPESVVAFDDRGIDVAADGSFRITFGPNSSTDFQLAPGSSQLVVREVYGDWSAPRGTIRIERTDTLGTAPPPDTVESAQRRFDRAARGLVSRVHTWLKFPEWFYLNLPANTMTGPRHTPGGLATQYSSAGHYELNDDQAMILTVPRIDVPYLGFQLGSMWYTSLDYVNHQTSLNAHQAQVDPDGKIRLIISERNPGVTNWLETTGHRRGFLQFRWQRTSRPLTPEDGPEVAVVGIDEVPQHLPFYESNVISPADFRARIAARQAAFADRLLG